MRRLIVSNNTSADGFIAGPNDEIEWFAYSGFQLGTEWGQYAADLISSVDGILLGRRTYEMFSEYWPEATDDNQVITERINNLPKFVFSKTLKSVQWGKWNTAGLVVGKAEDEVKKLKQQEGRDLVIYGSGQLVSYLANLGLIDEYQLVVRPIFLGKGRTQFHGLEKSLNLTTVRAAPFESGAVLLYLQPTGR